MWRKKSGCILVKKCAISLLLLVIVLSLPTFCVGHSNDKPSFKYSREANENFNTNKHERVHDVHEQSNNGHEHSHLIGHKSHAHSHFHGHEENVKNIKYKDMSAIWLYSIGSTLLISAAPFLLLFIIPLDSSAAMRPRLKVLLAFASGGLLGDAFLHLIPHATNPHHSHDHSQDNDHHHSHAETHFHNHDKYTTVGIWVLGGIVAFLTVEKLVRLSKRDGNSSEDHSPGKNKKPSNNDAKGEKVKGKIKNDARKTEKVEISAYLNLAADFAHNFTDGLAIGASFLAGTNMGIVTTATILLHEVPHEIGDFAILIKSGCSRRKAMLLQLVTALGALCGNALALIGVGAEANAAPWVLPFTAGGFIYIATVSVLPELLEESTKLGQSIKEICALLTGVILMAFIAYFE